jgi:hypothetical protein
MQYLKFLLVMLVLMAVLPMVAQAEGGKVRNGYGSVDDVIEEGNQLCRQSGIADGEITYEYCNDDGCVVVTIDCSEADED